jgi:hypothetical protein
MYLYLCFFYVIIERNQIKNKNIIKTIMKKTISHLSYFVFSLSLSVMFMNISSFVYADSSQDTEVQTPIETEPVVTEEPQTENTINKTTEIATVSLEVLGVEVLSNTEIILEFNKEPVLPENLIDAFSIQDSQGNMLDVLSAFIQSDRSLVLIDTAEQQALETYKVVALSSVTDLEGTPLVSGISDEASFIGSDKMIAVAPEPVVEEVHESAFSQKEVKDTEAPEDIRNFQSAYKVLDEAANSYTVDLDWQESLNSAKDLDAYHYQYKDSAQDYSNAISIEKEKTSYQTVLQGGDRYTFKISTVDTSGNTSTGAISSIILPETGPADILFLLVFTSFLGAFVIQRKKYLLQ